MAGTFGDGLQASEGQAGEAKLQLVHVAQPRAAWEQRKARGKGAEGIGKGVGGASGQGGKEKRADRQNEGAWEWLCLSATVEQCNGSKG